MRLAFAAVLATKLERRVGVEQGTFGTHRGFPLHDQRLKEPLLLR